MLFLIRILTARLTMFPSLFLESQFYPSHSLVGVAIIQSIGTFDGRVTVWPDADRCDRHPE